MEPVRTQDVAARYARFADAEAKGHSDVYVAWAEGVSRDEEVCRAISTLPSERRQPNIVFACARLLGAAPGPYENLRRVVLGRLDDLTTEVARRATQTNEAARTAALLPVLAHLSRVHDGAPLALVELGASAGLCLWPDRWCHRYVDRSGDLLAEVDVPDALGTHQVMVKQPLHRGGVGLPAAMPHIAHRAGLDLAPVDAGDPDARAWLETLVWPGQDHRRARLDLALDDAARHPSPVVAGDVRDEDALDRLLQAVPAGCVPVLFHTAVLAYLDDDDRGRVEASLLVRVHAGQCHWVANEGQRVLPGVAQRIDADAELLADLRKGGFVISLDGEPLYQADGHAAWLLG